MHSTAQQSQNLDQHHHQLPRLQIKVKDSPAPETHVGSALSNLLGPTMTPASFTTEYWCRKPLFIKGSPEKLQQLFPGGFERQDFDRAVREATVKKVKRFELWARTQPKGLPADVGQLPPYVFIEPDQIEWMLALGANVAASNISDQRVATFAAMLKAQLNHPGEVKIKATLSPQGNGWPPHLGAGSVFSIQCEGRKRFVISPEPVAMWPQETTFFSSDGTPTSDSPEIELSEGRQRIQMDRLIEVVLEPGDILFYPPGTVHATEALSETTLTLSLLFEHANFLGLISNALQVMFQHDPAWRHLPPVNSANVKPGELPAETAAFFAARLAELRDAINALTPDTPELNRQWQKSIAHPGETTLALLAPRTAQPNSRPVERQDLLRVSRQAPITYALGTDRDGDATMDLYGAGKEVSVAGAWVPFLKTLADTQRFTAESATQWAEGDEAYPWEIVQEYLEALLDQGILEREVA